MITLSRLLSPFTRPTAEGGERGEASIEGDQGWSDMERFTRLIALCSPLSSYLLTCLRSLSLTLSPRSGPYGVKEGWRETEPQVRERWAVSETRRDGRDRAHSLNSPLSASHLVPDPFHRVATRGHFPRSMSLPPAPCDRLHSLTTLTRDRCAA